MTEEEHLLLEAGQRCLDDVISAPRPDDG